MAESVAGVRPPAGKLNATLIPWGKGRTVFRVHRSIYKADQFNDSHKGDARFSPLMDAGRKAVIPTLYAGTTLDCALMESIFHDVPYRAGLKTVSKAKHVEGAICSSLHLTADLQLVDLSSVALHKLGVAPADLTQTEAAYYAASREWALALYEQNPTAQGFIWTSRRDDDAKAILLFGNRVMPGTLEVEADAFSLLQPDGSARMEVLSLAVRLDVLLVP
ncbi:RES family NAD+ phosphorylase [Silvibacterium acidisoli]|uniref:RES family NAD+ phosphorylase n=1 Tax=Acidobacteriaceae bacterium ZG23-2 TaxID=2883246 RepID=UPI00406C1DE9